MGEYPNTFAGALEALKNKLKVTRDAWLPHMWLILVPEQIVDVAEDSPFAVAKGARNAVIGSHIDMKTDSGEMRPGWLPLQEDLMAEDWRVWE